MLVVQRSPGKELSLEATSSLAFPRLPASGEPGRATQGQTATEGQSSEREETQTHGEVRRELTVADSRLNSLGEQ